MKTMQSRLGGTAIIVFVAVLLILWAAAAPLVTRFTGFNAAMTSLGQIFGLVGFMLLALTIVLESRMTLLERYFGGMNRVYIMHHLLGGVAFIFVLFHPVFLTIKYLASSVYSAAMFLVPGRDIYITTGILALILMSLFLFLTFYLKLPYHIWKISHALLAIVFLVIIFHSFFINSDLLRNPPLRLYTGFFALVGVGSALYQILTKTRIINQKIYEVVRTTKLNEQVTQVELEPKGPALKFRPGQFVFVGFRSRNISPETHPYSITSSPRDKTLRIAIKNLGDYTRLIPRLQPHDLAYIEGPFGYLSPDRYPNKLQLWIAGGIGITPFISMAKSVPDDSLDIYFYYSAMDQAGLIEAETFEEVARKHPNFHLHYFLFNERGLLTAKILAQEVPQLVNREVFICGPAGMMSSLRSQLVAAGLNSSAIHTEEFSL
ncbi:MAG: ferredoxin reductase family protein [Anaerolineae bacterium]